jgi:serine/threonine protein kinase
MTPERWQKIDELYQAALDQESSQRASFLSQACAGDTALLREVESLIASHEQAGNFIVEPALRVTAKVLAGDQSSSLVGGMFSHYRIEKLLGVGGMGEVYLAEDAILGRKIALKLLPTYFTRDSDRLRRFEQEARSASALNHPNILTIYEIGKADGHPYTATEFIDGETLREHVTNTRMTVSEVIDVATQIASALQAAHEAEIVHRDIKPENIMLRRDRVVKVLDFGLAKLLAGKSDRETGRDGETGRRGEGETRGHGDEETRRLKVNETPVAASPRLPVPVSPRLPVLASPCLPVATSPGVVMGTVGYMSPEQARGLDVDARTDLWSLGVVLYELIAERQPFEGATPMDVIISIAERQPVSLVQYVPEVPIQLERIVKKALEKDRERRYQSAKDLLIDLKNLRHELEIGAEVERHKQSTVSNESAGTGNHRKITLTRSRILILAAFMGMLIVAGFFLARFFRQSSTPASQAEIKSLAVLPLKSLNRGAGDDYLGLGIADTIITKVSQVGELTVRPTSAVRKYADEEIDSLEAARQLKADAVLDGTFLHSGDRLRVSVNLLRVRDGASLWADSFDMRFTDIFAIQDEVSKEVVARLRLKLSSAEQARLAKRHTTNPEAYSYFTKAMYHFSKRGFSGYSHETETAIDLFKKAIELDPNYALAHAQLGFAYAWIADYQEGVPNLIASAKEELRLAERLDPQLAEVHVARSFIAWSFYEDWQIEAAIREARLADQLDSSIPNHVLATLYYHIGLEELSAKEFELALERDPTSDTIKRGYLSSYSFSARPDEWLALNQRLFNRGPDTPYYLQKRMLREAEPLIEEENIKNPEEPGPRRDRALLLALQGKHREAQAAVPRIMEKVLRNKTYHHFTYDIARIYALNGKGEEALKWLRTTVKEGFPCYPLFARDSFLDQIRKDPAFIQFMTEMKTRWEGYRREFG